MLLQVLESVQQMLVDGLAVEDSKEARTYFSCARILLEKVIEIEELKSGNRKPIPVTANQVQNIEEGFVVDAPNGVMKKISYADGRELEAEKMVEINGMAVPYKQAVGMKCKTGRVL